jgi:hypothetical protein
MVSTHRRGAVIPISFYEVFLAPSHRDVAYSSALRVLLKVFIGTVKIGGRTMRKNILFLVLGTLLMLCSTTSFAQQVAEPDFIGEAVYVDDQGNPNPL